MMLNITLQRIGQKFVLANKEELITLLARFEVEWNIGYEDELALKEHLIIPFSAKRIGSFPFPDDTISCIIAFVRAEIVIHFLPSDLRNYGSLLRALEKEQIRDVFEELLMVDVLQEFDECAIFPIDAFLKQLLPDVHIVSYEVNSEIPSEGKIFLTDASDSRVVAYLENNLKDLEYREGKMYFTPYHPNENIAHYYFLFSLKQGKYISRLENILQERIKEYLSPSSPSENDEIIVSGEQMADLGYYPLHLQ